MKTHLPRKSVPLLFSAGLGLALLAGCASHKCCCSTGADAITKAPFGTADGQEVDLYTLSNKRGAVATIMNYGGIVTSLKVPDENGNLVDVVLGYDNLDGYLTNSPYFGALIGRYGNRIAKGKFTLDGVAYSLATNNYPNALHGGVKGFDKRVWTATPMETKDGPALKLTYHSADMEEGYPGNLNVTAVYTLTDDNALKLVFTATTDKDTIVNLTHHSYWNLSGRGDILDHLVYINADKFTPVDATLIPTGELRPVQGTPFDFTKPTAIGARINADDPQIKYGPGYDHNWVVNQKKPGQLTLDARVTSPDSGITMEVYSTEPCLQFYAGNFLDGTITGKGGRVYNFRNAFCMEPQHAPDSPNEPSWPSVVLKPGQTYHNTIIYKFTARK
ncbi:MAG TPA: aldose epimerase family protein [Verrucomicrobiae bacterium]|nr:aldose epimerase family protein [Verrucomicrobiae bacterium]